MVEIKTDDREQMGWHRYYPKYAGWNEGEDIDDQWYFEVSTNPSRAEAIKMRTALAESDGIDGKDILYMTPYVRGPFNIKVNKEEFEGTITEFINLVDAGGLVPELQNELTRRIELLEIERKNSDAPSGGTSTSPQSETQPAQSGESIPAESVSETQAPADAQSDTTPNPTGLETSQTTAPEVGGNPS